MRVLISGASGMIGSALAKALTMEGHDVLTLVRPQSSRTGIWWHPGVALEDHSDLEGLDAVVHLAGVISSWVSNRINADGITGRDLLGCAVAAAVSASFNAPIAGALFALEVVLRHFALHAFAPIVIASVAGTVINRLEFGDVTEFVLTTPGALQFYVELPAFLILGLICGVVAAAPPAVRLCTRPPPLPAVCATRW